MAKTLWLTFLGHPVYLNGSVIWQAELAFIHNR